MNDNMYHENVDAVIMDDEFEAWMKKKKFDYCIMNSTWEAQLATKGKMHIGFDSEADAHDFLDV